MHVISLHDEPQIQAMDLSTERVTLRQDGTWLSNLWVGSGTNVTPDMAMRMGAVFSCVDLIASKIACMPCVLYEQQGDSRIRATRQPLYRLLHRRPNPRMSWAQYIKTSVFNLLLWGWQFTEIQRNTSGYPVALWPMPSKLTRPVLNEQTGEIDCDVPMLKRRIPSRNLLHITGPSLDGYTGLAPIGMARAAAELSYSTDFYGNKFFSSGGLPRLVLEYPGELDDDAGKRLHHRLDVEYGELSQSQRVFIAESGTKLSTVSINPRDAQFLEVRQYSRAEIASLYHVPVRRVNGSNGPVGWGNIEQENIELLTDAIMPVIEPIKQEMDYKLLDDSDQYFVEIIYEGLLRTDIKTRYESYASGIQNGVLTPNEARKLENLPPYAGGDVPQRPVNAIAADKFPGWTPKGTESATGSTAGSGARALGTSSSAHGRDARATWGPVISDVAARIVRRAQADYDREAGKASATAESLEQWQREYFALDGGHLAWVAQQLRPLITAAGADDMTALTTAASWCMADDRCHTELVGIISRGIAGVDDADSA